jgi:hypothetical protein
LQRTMRFRKLRIAWSVVWGILWALLMVLWVRSANHYDYAQSTLFGLQKIAVSSRGSALSASFHFGDAGEFPDTFGSGRLNKLPPNVVESPWAFGRTSGGLPSPYGTATAVQYYVAMPHWFPVLIASVLAAAPWARTRFSLRTLLIATTLIAVVLGLIMYVTR